MRGILKYLFFALGIALCFSSFAQSLEAEQFDSLYHSSKKAAWRSALIPGWGQAYNKKHFKIPIIYAGLGTTIFFAIDNNRLYNAYKDEYTWREDGGNADEGNFPQYTDENLQDLSNTYRSNRDLALVFTALIYVFNIVDASVDAHFYGFDVSDDLSLDLRPTPMNIPGSSYQTIGLSLQLKL